MLQWLKRGFIKVKHYLLTQPIDPIAAQLASVDSLVEQFAAMDATLAQLEEYKPPPSPTHSETIDDIYHNKYQLMIVMPYQNMTPRQKQYYRLISYEEYLLILDAFRHGKFTRLKYGQWLNDEIINEYLKSLPIQPNTVILNTFHYQLLIKANDNSFMRILNKAKVDQTTQLLLIPYNRSNTHWFMFSIDLIQFNITIYDSMARDQYSMFTEIIKLANRIREGPYECYIAECPQQENHFDCGVFMIKNITILNNQRNPVDYYDQSTIFYDRLQICAQLVM